MSFITLLAKKIKVHNFSAGPGILPEEVCKKRPKHVSILIT
ncbi:MAG: hypothetical protein KatS3mg027_1593 [Bacteroidia bacterium]|nr:MAG: hypothetical protein KatS3mg027_1593 [Bacteroidia bacterium]